MTVAEVLVGWGFLVVWLGAPLVVAGAFRRRVLPGWTGAPALLIDAVTTLALVLTAAQLLGTAGGFTRPGMTAAALVVGTGGLLLARRVPMQPLREFPAHPERSWSRVLGVVCVAAVIGVWGSETQVVLSVGNYDRDTLVYHWPYAAWFAQSGWTTQIHLGAPGGGSSWHAANAELLGGISILAFHRDWMLPLLNFAWLGLGLLAARCIGRRSGAGGLAVSVACVLFAVPILARFQGGSGFSDTASLGLVLAAVALFLEAFDHGLAPQVLVWGGACAGLAASTKETTLAVGGSLTLAVLGLCVRWGRAKAFACWAGPALLLGCFWYLRNLAREGNPIPTSRLGPFRSIAGPAIDKNGYSVAHYLTDAHVIRHIFLPQLVTAWGLLWPLMVVGVLLAAALTLRRSTPGTDRALAVIGVVGLLAYLITPTTAFGLAGMPLLFPENTRYALPAMLVLAMLLVRRSTSGLARSALAVGVAVTLTATIVTRGTFPTVLPHHGKQAVTLAGIALVVLAAAMFEVGRWPHRGRSLTAIALAVAVSASMLSFIGARYERQRYPASSGEAARTYRWANTVHGAHIGVDGIQREYPYTGNDVSNRVNYIGIRDRQRLFTEAPSCALWRQAVNVGHFNYLVFGPLPGGKVPMSAQWVDRAATTPVLATAHYQVYRVVGALDPRTCPLQGASGRPST